MKQLLVIFLFSITFAHGQGYNHQWLLGYWNFNDPKGRMLVENNSYTLLTENRKMTFYGTEANISDANGNLLMSSNGVWVANATGDTMMNGSGLNPSAFTSNWPNGFPIGFTSIFLPSPGDSNKFVLFHKTLWGTIFPATSGFYKSIIDISLDNGLGAIIEKNDTLIADTLSWGLGACRHANGRDWWVVAMKDYNPLLYTFLLTPNGIDTMFIQSTGFIANRYGNVSSIVFSQDGKKMTYLTPIDQGPGGSNGNGTVLLFDFDRCTGIISNQISTQVSNGNYLWGLTFSPSGQYLYACTSNNIFQIDTDNINVDTVATYDGFISPGQFICCATTFFNMYLAANGKIYVTSGSGVQHLHEINYPDSAGIACDVQQHSIFLGYAQLRAVPNHPNYYLGCDTTSSCVCLTTSLEELEIHDFKFSVSPNPSNGDFNISYILPQNEKGRFEVFDINGRLVFEMNLPQWSTMQEVSLPSFISAGIYNCVLTSNDTRVNKKVAIIK